MKTKTDEQEYRVLVLMPTGRDAELVAQTLRDVGIRCDICTDREQLLREMASGAGTALLAEEAVDSAMVYRIVATLAGQPVWSDLPVILFSSNNRKAESYLETLGGRINVTIVERPIRITMLVSAVRGALRARQRQYQTRDLLDELEQADKQKDLFLATLSHELRTPLNSILGWIQILRAKKLKLEETEHAIKVIERNAKSQAEMISDILFVSRIITGKLEIKHEPIDLADIVDSAVEMIKPSADAKSIALEVDTNGYDPAPIQGDAERLQQVLLNLLTNAIKFTPDAGRVTVRLRRVGSNVTISVEDTGQGISPKFLPYAFEQFRQADSSYTRRIGGLGLGLTIVRHLIDLHGGTVSATSQGKDLGSTFTITLPIADTRRISATRPSDDATASRFPNVGGKFDGMSILLVEDDTDSREMLTKALTIFGVKVVAADSVADALDKLGPLQPDFVISDIGLPGEDGYDLIRKLRSLPAESGGNIPAIALTGYVSVQDRNLALEAGYQEHLPKPVDTNRLVELLGQLRSGRSHTAG